MDRLAIIKSIVGAVIAAPFAYVLKKTFEAWGILDPIAAALGGWLKVHVPSATAGWTLAVLVSGGLYGVLLSRVWRPRHTHHLPIMAEAKPVATLEAKLTKAAPIGRHGKPGFVGPSITTAYLSDIYRERTHIQADKLATTFVGKRIEVSGTVAIVTALNGTETTLTIKMDRRAQGFSTAWLLFPGDRDRLEMLRIGDQISVIGKIKAFDQSELQLIDCHLGGS